MRVIHVFMNIDSQILTALSVNYVQNWNEWNYTY